MFAEDAQHPDMLTFKQLIERTGESERTLRYYLHLGLLDGPSSTGPGARYHRDNVDKVHWIRQRQREGKGLREIQKELQAGSGLPRPMDSGAAQHSGLPLAASGGAASPHGSLAFLRRHSGEAEHPVAMRKSPALQRETWERTVLEDGIELWVRRPLDPHRQRRLTQLLARAEEYFNSGKRAAQEEP